MSRDLTTVIGMRAGLVLATVVLACAWAAQALGNHLEPQEQLRAADQTRARAMLLRRGDLGPGYAVERTSDLAAHVTCAALDLSSLVVTGRARTPTWSRTQDVLEVLGSSAAVYTTSTHAARAWRRSTSAAGAACVRNAFQDMFRRQGESVRVSIARLPFPKLASGTSAWRLTVAGATGPPVLALDTVALSRGRAQAAILFAGVIRPVSRAREVALARIVARRMQAAMRRS